MPTIEETRQMLQAQLDLVLVQKRLLEGHLADLHSQPRPVATAPLKRSAPVAAVIKAQPCKRQRVGGEKGKRLELVWQQVFTVLKALMKQRDAQTFSTPVDAIKLGVPDYYKIIRKPMDLGTVKSKLEHHPERGKPRMYTTPYEVRDDIRQVWTNCAQYNPPNTPVRIMGDRLTETWEKKWHQSGIEARWEGLMRELTEEELGPALVALRMKEMSGELQQLLTQAPPEKGCLPLAQTGPRELSFEEKRKLSVALGSLPGERLGRVLEIIAEGSSAAHLGSSGTHDELELDIDQLDNATLFNLDQYTSQVLAALEKKVGGQPMNGVKTAVQQKSRTQAPVLGKSAPQQQQAPPQPSAPAVDVAPAPAGTASNSSSSNSGSSNSSSDSESAGEVGSKDDGATSGAANKAGPTLDQSAFVSSTQQPLTGIYQQKSKKGLDMQNAGAWGALATAPEDTTGGAAAEEASDAAAGGGGTSAPDALWTEFQSREQEQLKREKEKKSNEERLQAEKAKEIEAAKLKAERQRALADAEVEAGKKLAAEAAAKLAEEAEAERRAELQQLKEMALETGAVVDQQDVMKKFERGGGGGGQALGLSMKDEDEEEEEEEEGDDDDDDDEPEEEGELA